MAGYREYFSLTGDELEQFGGALKQIYNTNGYAIDLSNGTDVACAAYGAAVFASTLLSMRNMGAIKDHKEMVTRWSLILDNGGLPHDGEQ